MNTMNRCVLLSCIIIFLLFPTLLLGAASLSSEKEQADTERARFALVVGNSNYRNAPLRNPINDATDIANSLKRNGFTVTLLIDCEQKQMEKAIRKFGRQLLDGGIGLFYFAGHGIQYKGRNYLIPIGADIESEADIKYEGVDTGRVLEQMEVAANGLNIIILDACRNNPFARSFRSAEQGLAKMDAPTGSLIAYATAPGSVAADGDGRNGVYTKYLLRHINTSGLAVERVFKQVRKDVLKATGGRQTPWESSSLTGEFSFSGTVAPAKESVSPGTTDHEGLYWQSVQDSNDLSMYRAYLVRFPDGTFSNLAELKIEQLSTPTTGSLIVRTTPADTQVRILNIKSGYRAGIKLKPGSYTVEVSKSGFIKNTSKIQIKEGVANEMSVVLEELIEDRLHSLSHLMSRLHFSKGDTINQAVDSLEQKNPARAEKLFRDAGWNSTADLFHKTAKFQQICRHIASSSGIGSGDQLKFSDQMQQIKADIILWSPREEKEEIMADYARLIIKNSLGILEEHYSQLKGNGRDLIAILNDCRELHQALGISGIEKRYPVAVAHYRQYANKQRVIPAWATTDDFWVDSDTGLPLKVRDKIKNKSFILIPEGKSFVGDPATGVTVALSAFYIQAHEVSNDEFLSFCMDTGWQRPAQLARKDGNFSDDDQPVVNVSYLDAISYGKWFSKKLKGYAENRKWKALLPTELQWERASRLEYGVDHHMVVAKAKSRSLNRGQAATPRHVHTLGSDISIPGVMGLGGNVAEWCLDGWVEEYEKQIPMGTKDLILGNNWEKRKVVKGGTYFSSDIDEFSISRRQPFEPGNRIKWIGFRIVIAPKRSS